MFGYIYETTNLINGKKYIGQKQSSFFVENYFGSGVLITQAIKKYGVENFSVKILKECNSKKELNDSEIFFIKIANAVNSSSYYNIARGGEGGDTYAGKSELELNVIKNKISAKNSGSNNGNKGQYVGQLNSMYGKKHSLESRIKISESLKKNKNKQKPQMDVGYEY